MSTQIGIVGEIQEVTEKQFNTVTVYCIEMVIQSNPAFFYRYPGGFLKKNNLQPIQYSIILERKIYKKFLFENFKVPLEEGFSKIVGNLIKVYGVPVLDLPLTVASGDIGIIAHNIQLLNDPESPLDMNLGKKDLREQLFLAKEKIKEISEMYSLKKANYKATIRDLSAKLARYSYRVDGQIDQYFMISVDELEPLEFFTEPSPIKVELAMEYYHSHGELEEINVKILDDKWFIVDGYAKFIAAKKLGLKKVKVRNTILLGTAEEIQTPM